MIENVNVDNASLLAASCVLALLPIYALSFCFQKIKKKREERDKKISNSSEIDGCSNCDVEEVKYPIPCYLCQEEGYKNILCSSCVTVWFHSPIHGTMYICGGCEEVQRGMGKKPEIYCCAERELVDRCTCIPIV